MDYVRKKKADGNKIILWTNRQGKILDKAVEFLKAHDVPIDYINENPEFETGSRKIYADEYIDDRSIHPDKVASSNELHKALTKPSYAKMDIADLDPTKGDEAWSAKIDGAHTVIEMTKGEVPKHYGHRLSLRTGGPLEYTAKLPNVKTAASHTAIVRGETYAVDKEGHAVHPDIITALLNSGVEKSLQFQKKLGITTKTALFDVDNFEGRDMKGAAFSEKRKILEDIVASNPDYGLPDTAYTAEEKSRLLNAIVNERHPQTREGIVVHDLSARNKPYTKAKVINHHDVYVTGIFPEEGVKEGRKPMAGGFTYSWEPDGDTVGKVGTGFSHEMKVDMLAHPEDYIGRAAKVKALDVSKNKALVKPSFDGWHVEKNLV
jgi:ATP-dependent DNA ligase